MDINPAHLTGVHLIETSSFLDHRGKFARFFCKKEFKDLLKDKDIEQVNYSLTAQKGAVRGLHFQHAPMAEVKMLRCLSGSVFDVMVDLRKDSPTFLKWCGEIISQENMKMMYVPEGFAHGFQALEDDCELLYLVTAPYSPEHEGGLRHDDPMINIDWPLETTEISEKDRSHPLLKFSFKGIVL